MSFDAQITELNTNIKALIAALVGVGSVSTASTGTAAATTGTMTAAEKKAAKAAADKAAAPKGPTREEMVAALTEVKEKFGAADAKAIIEKMGAKKMVEIADDKIEAAFKAAKSKLEASTGEDDDSDGDI